MNQGPDIIESQDRTLPSEAREDVEGRLGARRNNVRSVELRLTGENVEGAREFARLLIGLKKRGVRISHDLTIRLDFPKGVHQDLALALVEGMPRPHNGSVKVRLKLDPRRSPRNAHGEAR
ncbi:MAG: hypothetical protein MOGMAGMI_00669 [Candidatus Omnitrophica bacterium]|nr:hypothetical protein [Candidatus Omnitrophota bacterium]